ncbi:MAG: TonB-dependent receptor domain-containing protein, partial [Ignavibacteriales bacterium]
MHKSDLKRLLCGAAAMALALPMAAHAEVANFNIAAQPLSSALKEFSIQSQYSLVAPPDVIAAKTTAGVSESAEPEIALAALLQGTGLSYRREGNTFLIVGADAPQSGSAAGDGAGTVEALIVTAQKKEEAIQDVPIAISAFTEKSLEEQKIEGGFDLLKAIPNVTFSKNNFTSYNFSIRGIGTKAVSATTDPGVAVSFNNVALIQNRLFEQEYFDVERVEVLRGPQGTLYGRNATAGVVNLISAKPDMDEFKGWLKGEVGNYHTKRLSAMVNVPLIEDKLAIRFAGALTERQGYDYNTGTHHAVNGRDLWSGRITIGFDPTESLHADLVWERFNEDDNRSRTGKQLCHRDDGREYVGTTPTASVDVFGQDFTVLRQALFSQGCKAGSLYENAAFGTPNGLALPLVWGLLMTGSNGFYSLNYPYSGYTGPQTLIALQDPYGGMMQSRDLRMINSFRDPVYRAKADIVELNINWSPRDAITITSQMAYNRDSTYSFQDYNRFNTTPIFVDTSNFSVFAYNVNPTAYRTLAPGGVFCDPQLGCSNTFAAFDIAQAKGEQFSQEVRIQSSFGGAWDFSAGANYTQYRTSVDYYVMSNLMTAMAMVKPFNLPEEYPGAVAGWDYCYGTPMFSGGVKYPLGAAGSGCPYIDPNPVESLNGEGHNYFRSKNPYKLKSGAVFGELYWRLRDDLKLTAGGRYTDDRKVFIPVPSQLLLAEGYIAGGDVNRGYPELEPIKQRWGEWTGRIGVDWKPRLSWSDQTLIYAFYSHGYKAGGANPPQPGFSKQTFLDVQGFTKEQQISLLDFYPDGPVRDYVSRFVFHPIFEL